MTAKYRPGLPNQICVKFAYIFFNKNFKSRIENELDIFRERLKVLKQIQTPRYIVQNSMNLKFSINIYHLTTVVNASTFFLHQLKKLERHIVLEKGFSEKISTRKQYTISSHSKCFISKFLLHRKIYFRNLKQHLNFHNQNNVM